MTTLISIALYVLQAIGLCTIANRRGIARPWLAWVPVGSLWLLGAICDDYQQRRGGKRTRKRTIMLVLAIASAVLLIVSLVLIVSSMLSVVTTDELMDIVYYMSAEEDDLYVSSAEETLNKLLQSSLAAEKRGTLIAGAVLAILGGIASTVVGVLECICMYKLFESCDPARKMVYFLVGLFVGLWPVFVFVVKDRDLGIPRNEPVGIEAPGTEQ